ncbi:MAG: hypothetical protein J5J00_13850, partial [Deltaproteobacteria bacterium]|nr:hypothetical protein [Deltaproteobacteria bacterium]
GGALTLRDVPKGTGHIDRAASPPGTFQKSSPLEKFRKSKYKDTEEHGGEQSGLIGDQVRVYKKPFRGAGRTKI